MLFVWNFDKLFNRKIIAGYFMPVLVRDVSSIDKIVLPFSKWTAIVPFYRRINEGVKIVLCVSANRFWVLHNNAKRLGKYRFVNTRLIMEFKALVKFLFY